jgi:hypothetical protein
MFLDSMSLSSDSLLVVDSTRGSTYSRSGPTLLAALLAGFDGEIEEV